MVLGPKRDCDPRPSAPNDLTMWTSEPDLEHADLAERRERINRALDMVVGQAGCTRDEALSRLSRLTVDTCETLGFVASCVLDGTIHFD